MNPTKEHLQKVSRQLGEPPPEHVDNTRAHLLQALAQRAPNSGAGVANRWRNILGWKLATGTFAVAAVAVALFAIPLMQPTTPTAPLMAPFTVAINGVAAGAQRPLAVNAGMEKNSDIVFSDGSHIVMQRGAMGVIAHTHVQGVELNLGRGALVANLAHSVVQQWTFLAGGYVVQTQEAKFSLSWEATPNADAPDQGILVVSVATGAVEVRGPGMQPTALMAGQTLHQPPARNPPQDPAPITRPAPKTARLEPSWQQLEHRGDSQAAVRAARTRGFPTLFASLPVGDLYTLANLLRSVREAELAEQARTALSVRFAGSEQAALVPFLRGRLEAELRGRPVEAARHFASYLETQKDGPMEEEALGRLVEAHLRANNSEAAQVRASEYLKRYPHGAYQPLAERALEGTPADNP